MAEWEAIRSQIKIEPEVEGLSEELAETPVAAVEPKLDVVTEAPLGEVTVELEAAEAVEVNGTAAGTDGVAAPVLEEALSDLISQEKTEEQEAVDVEAPALSLEEGFAALSFDQSAELEEDEDEADEGEVVGQPLEGLNLTPDAGKIRFAEDILEEFRGTGRGRGGGKKSGGNRGNRSAKARRR